MRLLIADDNWDLAKSVALLLRREGFEVEFAYDGEQAIETALLFHPDILILDLCMPRRGGVEVAEYLRALPNFSHTVFVALTGYCDEEHLAQAANSPFDAYLIKPFRVDKFLEMFDRMAGRAAPHPAPPRPKETTSRNGSEVLLRSVLEHVLDGIITIDKHGTIESFNPAATKIFGYETSEVIGQNVKMLMPAPYHDEHDGYLANYLSTGKAKIIGIGREVVGRRKDGSTFPMELAVSDFYSAEKRFFTGIVRDITERKRLEQELRQRVQELNEADRRKNQFLATLAHELRNPLTPIVSAVQLLQIKGPPDEEMQWARGVIARQAEQMVRLIDDLLDISRITRGKVKLRRERIDLKQVVNSALESCDPLIKQARHRLTVTLPDESIYVDADSTRLAQVILNLLNNAVKFTPSGGQIWLAVAKNAENSVEIRVRDSGIGIPVEALPHLFEMFMQVNNSLERTQSGLGIGLSLVRGLVELHGGTVEANSAGPNLGSEFTVRLPLSQTMSPPAVVEPRSRIPAKPAVARRILMVDDNRAVADGFATLLKSAGNDVITAYDGPTAIRAAAQFQPEVVFCDIGMPGMNGYDVARALRADPRAAGTLLVAVTGWGQEEDRRRSEEAGFNAHLVKPVGLDVLQEVCAGYVPNPS